MIFQIAWPPIRNFFACYTLLFSVVHDVNTSAKVLNDDLKKVNDWTGLSNGKWVSILIRANEPRKLLSVANQSDPPNHLQFLTTIIKYLKPFLKNTWVSN